MDSHLRITLEELAGHAALDRAKDALQTELGKGGSRLASLNWNIFRDAAVDEMKVKIAKHDWVGSIGGVWCKARKLRELAIKTRAAPGKEEPLSLGEHALTLDLHPTVTLRCGPIELPPLVFTLRLDVLIGWAVLVVKDGRLSALEGAVLTPSANLYYKEHHLSELAKREVPITERYTFSDGGIDIPCD